MKNVKALVESLLFISAHPLTVKKLSEHIDAPAEEVASALAALVDEYRENHGGVQLSRLGQSYQFSTTGESAEVVQAFLEEEEKKELTKPSLETLTIIAYRGPIAKSELELIRGVNCSLILRNLLIRGLIEELPDELAMTSRYQVTFDFLHYLGLREVRELPEYEKLNANEDLAKLLRTLHKDEESEQPKDSELEPNPTKEEMTEKTEDEDDGDEDDEETKE